MKLAPGATSIPYTPPSVWLGKITNAWARLNGEADYSVATPYTLDDVTTVAQDAGALTLAPLAPDSLSTFEVGKSVLVSGVGTNVADAIGAGFVVDVVGVQDDGGAILASPLPIDIPIGARLLGWHVVRACDPLSVGDRVASWRIEIDGSVRTFAAPVTIATFDVAYGLNGERLVSLYPRLDSMRGAHDRSFDGAIANAWAVWLKPKLVARGVDVAAIRDWEPIDNVLAAVVWYRAVVDSEDFAFDFVERAQKDLAGSFDDMLAGRSIWADDPESLTPATDSDQRLGHNSIIAIR